MNFVRWKLISTIFFEIIWQSFISRSSSDYLYDPCNNVYPLKFEKDTQICQLEECFAVKLDSLCSRAPGILKQIAQIPANQIIGLVPMKMHYIHDVEPLIITIATRP